MKKTNISKNFTDIVIFSKKNVLDRFFNKPIETTYKVIFSRIYNLFLKDKTITIKGDTFWGDKMIMVLPEDLSLFHFKLVPGEEENLTDFIIGNIKKGWTVIDIGANHGYYTLLLSELVGESGKVYSFEPTPSTVEILEKNARNKNNIIIEQKAVWSENTIIDFTDFGQGFSAYNSYSDESTWKDTEKSINTKKIKVAAIKIDDYFRENNIKPDFIKLDVEGAELNSLHGMKEFLEKNSTIISVEFWVNKLWNKKNEEIISFMKELRYSPYEILPGQTVPFKNKKFKHDYVNVIFIKEK